MPKESIVNNKIVDDPKLLNLKEDEFDAISFFCSKEGYKFYILKFNTTCTDYEQTEMGYRYYMLEVEKDGSASVQEAILGDPLHILRGFTKANCEGIFMKKCALAKTMLEKLVFGKDSQKRFEDFQDFIRNETKVI